jgi:hypothetical protein
MTGMGEVNVCMGPDDSVIRAVFDQVGQAFVGDSALAPGHSVAPAHAPLVVGRRDKVSSSGAMVAARASGVADVWCSRRRSREEPRGAARDDQNPIEAFAPSAADRSRRLKPPLGCQFEIRCPAEAPLGRVVADRSPWARRSCHAYLAGVERVLAGGVARVETRQPLEGDDVWGRPAGGNADPEDDLVVGHGNGAHAHAGRCAGRCRRGRSRDGGSGRADTRSGGGRGRRRSRARSGAGGQ